MRRFAVAAALFLISAAIAPSWAISPPDDDQIPNAVDVKQLSDAETLFASASSIISRFKSDPKMLALMRQASGTFVIPAFGHANPVAGAHWGNGVLLANKSSQWADPVIFDLGGGSLGPHTIANGGALILFIMNDRAMAKFASQSNWSLNSAPGTNIVNYSAASPQDLSGHGADIVAWSASGGPNSDTQVSISDISFDSAVNMTVYGTSDLRSILANRAPYINQTVISLRKQMPAAANTASAQTHPSGHA